MKLYQFKTKLSEIKSYPFCLGDISNDFAVDNMKRTGLNVYVHDFFFVDFMNIVDISKYLMKKTVQNNAKIY